MSNLINLTTQDRILTMQMNRPDKKNALTLDMYTIMAGAMRAAQDDPDVRVLLFTGALDGMFRPGLQRIFAVLTPAQKAEAVERNTVKSES